MGEKTKEKYDKFKKSSAYNSTFKEFLHYNFEEENKNDIKFKNPHDGSEESKEKDKSIEINLDESNLNNSILIKNDGLITSRVNIEKNASTPVGKNSKINSLNNSVTFLNKYESPFKALGGMGAITSRGKTPGKEKEKSCSALYYVNFEN